MEVREYYTPNPEDLFIGYEFERKDHKGRWEESKFRDEDFSEAAYSETLFRTPYLNKSDIESLGFSTPPYTQIEGIEYYKFLEDNTEVRIVLNGYEDYSRIIIKYDLDIVFNGVCKSKNEFRRLMNWLNIPIK